MTRETLKRSTKGQEKELETLKAASDKIGAAGEKLQNNNERLEKEKEELQATNSGLTALNVHLNTKVKRSMANLKRVDTELEQFAFVASHELQEPLRMLSIYTELLKRKLADKLDKETNEYFGITMGSTERMKMLVEALLNFLRTTREELRTDPTDCNAVMSQVLISLDFMIKESHAQIKCDRLPTILSNDFLLGQIFQHLIGNAIKFRRPAQVPEIHISIGESASEWQFSVQDNGIGIKKEHVDRIFLLFQRLHGRKEYPGIGIGLSMCRNIVERYGGRIWLESELGKGSAFFFTLPKLPRETIPSEPQLPWKNTGT